VELWRVMGTMIVTVMIVMMSRVAPDGVLSRQAVPQVFLDDEHCDHEADDDVERADLE